MPPFQGENKGSIPLGRANKINALQEKPAPADPAWGNLKNF